MKENKYVLNTALAVVLGIVLLAAVIVRAFAPAVILPQLNIPNVVLICVPALLADHYLAPGAKRCWVCIIMLSAVTFGLLPFAACFTTAAQALKQALVGGIVFTATAWLYSSIQDRLSSGPAAKAAPLLSAFGLYLAAQCFAGLIL